MPGGAPALQARPAGLPLWEVLRALGPAVRKARVDLSHARVSGPALTCTEIPLRFRSGTRRRSTHTYTHVELWSWGHLRGDRKQGAAASRGWTEGFEIGPEFYRCKYGEWSEAEGRPEEESDRGTSRRPRTCHGRCCLNPGRGRSTAREPRGLAHTVHKARAVAHLRAEPRPESRQQSPGDRVAGTAARDQI